MDERDEALIERYLTHQASAEEILEVEERRENDQVFRQALADTEIALHALRVHQREELRNRFRKRDEILDQRSTGVPPPNRKAPWLWVLVFVGLGILIWWMIPTSQKSVSPDPAHLQDSLSTSEQQNNSVDTTTHQESQQAPPSHDEEQDRQESKPMAEADEQGDKLFAAYFSPHVDDMMDPAVRGDGELTPLEKFQLAYWEKRYADALKEFPAISATMRQNDNIRFMQANALMAVGNISDAQKILQSILVNKKSRYLTEVYWYLGLCELKGDKLRNTRKHLEVYLQSENVLRKAEAGQILNEIR